MGMKGIEIVKRAGLDVEALVKLLNKAYSDEWLAYYQYWVGAQIVVGPLSNTLREEFEEHADEELLHARKLANRISELGGKPALSPDDWYNNSTCGYLIPSDAKSCALLKQNLRSERCAIEVYSKILMLVKGKDLLTSKIIREILADEVEHENDLEGLESCFMTNDDSMNNTCGCDLNK